MKKNMLKIVNNKKKVRSSKSNPTELFFWGPTYSGAAVIKLMIIW